MNTSPNQPASEARPWLPIETAPKDGTPVELRWQSLDGIAFDTASFNGELWVAKRLNRWTGLSYICRNPTHFRPLPLARTEEAEHQSAIDDHFHEMSSEMDVTRTEAGEEERLQQLRAKYHGQVAATQEEIRQSSRMTAEDMATRVGSPLSTKPEEVKSCAPTTSASEPNNAPASVSVTQATTAQCTGASEGAADVPAGRGPNPARDAAREIVDEIANALNDRRQVTIGWVQRDKILAILSRHIPNVEQLRKHGQKMYDAGKDVMRHWQTSAEDLTAQLAQVRAERDAISPRITCCLECSNGLIPQWDFEGNELEPTNCPHCNGTGEVTVSGLIEELKALREQVRCLPADWRQDSSLETWFPYTRQELDSLRADRDALRKEVEEMRGRYEGKMECGHIRQFGTSGSVFPIHCLACELAALRAAQQDARKGQL